jgi:threonine synthase
MIHCTQCQTGYPNDQTPYNCPACGGIFDFISELRLDPEYVDLTLPCIWRYQHALGLPKDAPITTLGEGNTPLVWSEVFGQKIAFKLEFLNPTGSFKDRGTAPLTSFLRSQKVKVAIEDSSGNAGASFAAYAAVAGIEAKIFIPSYASGPKRSQIEAYGAEVIRVEGPRHKAKEAVERAAQAGEVYASHVYMPQCIPGFATIAYEIFDQLGEAPGSIIAPVGQGSLLLGIGRGFRALQKAHIVKKNPVLVGVQAEACSPFWISFKQGSSETHQVVERDTLAEGVRTQDPVRGKLLLQIVRSSKGQFVAVPEDKILSGRDELAYRGLFVEPTSAIVWDGLSQVVGQIPEPIVIILTGSGLKSNL